MCSFFYTEPPQEQKDYLPQQQERPHRQDRRPRRQQDHRPRQQEHSLLQQEHQLWQQEQRPRQRAPTIQWQRMQYRHPQSYARQGAQQLHKQLTQRPTIASRLNTTTWCKHIHNCLQGRFCVLSHEGEEDFSNLNTQGRQ